MSDKTNNATTINPSPPPFTEGSAGRLSKSIVHKLLQIFGSPPVNIRLWDGTEFRPRRTETELRLHILDRATLVKLLIHPDLYFGEAYMQGKIEIEGDLIQFMETVYQGRKQTRKGTWTHAISNKIFSRPQTNSLDRSRKNIHQHYNLGNDFYTLWLDKAAMQYTCAYFQSPDDTLEQAQVAKLDHVCRKLQLKPGDSVVEAGCGWGGLARHMAKHYGVRVRAFNISQQQVEFAREKARQEGLDHQVEYVLDDYRNITGQYDAFVSVGMLEHVGQAYYPELNRIIGGSLKSDGRGLIHTIGRNHPMGTMNAWIERYIFPGANPPSLKEMMDIFEPNNLSVLDVENLRMHYYETLIHWLNRFDAQIDPIKDMFDTQFIRAWRLYLAGSAAAFSSANLQLFQVVFSRAFNNHIPRTRRHIYTDSSDNNF